MTNKPFVLVIWWDAEDFSQAGWASEEQLIAFNSEACEVKSHGYLVSKTRHYVTIAADLIEPITYGRSMKIPMKMIKSITELDLTPKSIV